MMLPELERDEAAWTLPRLAEEGRKESMDTMPNETTLRRMIREYRDLWHDAQGVYEPWSMMNYIYSRQNVDPRGARMTLQGICDYDSFLHMMRQHEDLFSILHRCVVVHDLKDDDHIKRMMTEARRVLAAIRSFFTAMARLYVTSRLDPASGPTWGEQLVGEGMLEPSERNRKSFEGSIESYLEYAPEKNDNFQNALMSMREKLEGLGYRRAEDRLFRRVMTKTGLKTMAYEFSTSVKDFVSTHTSYTSDFQVWRWATRPMANLEHLEKYISHRHMPEAPPLKENHHLRSYSGDELGRGAVVYCSKSDFAFEYRHREEWGNIAEWVTTLRRKMLNDPAYVCTAPDPGDVCIAHLDCVFPYDIYKELQDLEYDMGKGIRFRECNVWELDRKKYPVDLPRVSWHLHLTLPDKLEKLNVTVGKRWRLLFPHDTHDLSLSRPADLDPVEMEHLRESCDNDWKYDTFDLPRWPSKTFDPMSHVVLPADGHMWRSVDTQTFISSPANEIDDAGFLAEMENYMSQQQTGTCVRIPTRHLEGLALTDQSFVTLTDGRKYVPCKRILIPLVDQGMQPRAILSVVGSLWQRVDECQCLELFDQEIRSTLEKGVARARAWGVSFPSDPATYRVSTKPFDVAAECFVRLSDGTLMKQMGIVPRSFDGHGQYLTQGDRCFCVDTGRACFDFDTDEIDHIYTCQRFVDHDKFFLYALKGRLLFRVGEMDTHQLTLFFEGYGGCGKSTIMNAQLNFFPPHKRGILSSNVEPLFGMSQVMKDGEAEVIFCNEVASDLSLKQEEWQISTGGEMASYAVKNGKPLVMKCKAQHFWIGNGRPGFKNDQNQMGRRLGAVLMPYPVRPRDGGIALVIDKKLGNLHRREVVSYQQFVRHTGSCDPMSVPERLPPAFRDYHERCRRETDPVQDFIKDGSFVRQVDIEKGYVTMERFKELYEDFRNKHNMGRIVKWGEAVYRPAFNENHVHLKCVKELLVEGAKKVNIMVAYGLEEVV
tara:strand:- start:1129 stop:4110 length:2982 start_codon:yes stop_codon:yes gene_type:complete